MPNFSQDLDFSTQTVLISLIDDFIFFDDLENNLFIRKLMFGNFDFTECANPYLFSDHKPIDDVVFLKIVLFFILLIHFKFILNP